MNSIIIIIRSYGTALQVDFEITPSGLCLVLTLRVEDSTATALADSGASVSLMPRHIDDALGKTSRTTTSTIRQRSHSCRRPHTANRSIRRRIRHPKVHRAIRRRRPTTRHANTVVPDNAQNGTRPTAIRSTPRCSTKPAYRSRSEPSRDLSNTTD